MSNHHETILADLKARQLAGEHMKCPPVRLVHHEARPSYQCTQPSCRHLCLRRLRHGGGLLVFTSAPLPMRCWAALQPKQPASDFKARCSSDVLSEVMRTQVPFLIETFRQLDRGELDSEDARYDVLSHCAGLVDFGTSPFHAQYDTADGMVQIYIHKRRDMIEYAATAFAR